MDHVLLARSALSFLCATQGIATVAIDLNRTHAANPLWTGHARFHIVWQSSAVLLHSLVELGLIWWSGPYSEGRFCLAVILAAVSPLGFLAAFAGRKLFAGTLSDPNGIPPLKFSLLGGVRSVDMNLAAVIAALIALGLIIAIYRS